MIRLLVKDSMVYGGSDFILKLITFFTFPIIASVLTPQEFGTLELIGTVIGFGVFVAQCGLTNATQRYYWDSDEQGNQINIISAGLFSMLFISLLIVLLSVVSVQFIREFVLQSSLSLSMLLVYSAIGLVFFIPNQRYILDTLRLHFAPWKYFAFNVLSRILVVLSGLYAVVVLHRGIEGLLLSQLIISLLAFPFGLYLIKKDLSFNVEHKWVKKLVVFGSPYILVDMGYWIFTSTDRWMLAEMTNVEEVGIYSIALRFSMIVLFISTAFGMAWSPYAIKIKSDFPGEYRKIYAEILYILIVLLVLVGGTVAVFSTDMLSLLMPKEYAYSAIPLSILCFGIVIQATQQITAIGISIEKKTYLFARIAWVTAIVNVCLNYFLIPEYGVAGASWATLCSYLLLSSSYLYFTQKLHPIPVNYTRLAFVLLIAFLILLYAINLSASIGGYYNFLLLFFLSLVSFREIKKSSGLVSGLMVKA